MFNKLFQITQHEKEKALIEIFKQQLERNKKNKNIESMYNKLGFDIKYLNTLDDIPYIPVSMF